MSTDEATKTESNEGPGLEELRMGFLEHLGELRRRIIVSLIAVAIAFGITWFFVADIFDFLQAPLLVAAPEESMAQLHQQDMAEVFFTVVKAALLASVFLASPILLFQIWKFVAPGLYPNEKKAVFPFISMGTFFFFLGAGFCYYVVIPLGYGFLYDFSETFADPVLMIQDYFSLTTKLLLGFGLVFELPVVVYFLSAVGIITHRELIKQWRIAIVVSFIIAAILTPPDIITQVLLAGPMILLYGLSIGIAYLQTGKRERRNQD